MMMMMSVSEHERYLASGECRDVYLHRYSKGPRKGDNTVNEGDIVIRESCNMKNWIKCIGAF